MKILDRYVLISFLKNYFISLMVLIGLYVVLDMVFNFDELAELKGSDPQGGATAMFSVAWSILDYYFHQSFLIFVHLSGIIPVVAAAFTFIRMSRFNELTAILAAGVSLLRVAAPVIFCGVVINILLLPVTQEVIIPSMIPKLTLKHDELQGSGAKSFQIRAMQDESNALLNVGRYTSSADNKSATMQVIDVIERDGDYRPSAHISAESAEYDPSRGGWALTKGVRVRGLSPGQERGRPEPIDFWKTSINPEEIALYRSGDFVDLLPTSRINDLLARPKSYGTTSLMRVKHFRLAQLLMNIILLLLAIPCVLTREPGTLKQAALKAGILSGLCMALAFIMRQVAGNPPAGEKWINLWPAMMAWVPIFLFLPIAMFLLDRLQTKKT
jgi:lipopolysaccharide export LptBFGC system permease protein LptF